MNYDLRKHDRQSIRLHGYDYSYAGLYFVTICVNDRQSLFGKLGGDKLRPTPAGRMVRSVWDLIPEAFPDVETDSFVVMPNHVHGIIAFTAGPVGCGVAPKRKNQTGQYRSNNGATLSDVLRWMKSTAVTRYRINVRRSGWRPYSVRLWQRNYYEHIIRDADSLARIRKYITENPSRWHLDRENPDRTGDDEFDVWLDSISDQQEEENQCA